MSEPTHAGATEAVGFFAGLRESFRAHLDERLKSPFAGAFVLAWISVNWKSLLILLLSEKAIEDRISVVTQNYSNPSSIVWRPLILAVGIAVGFYLMSALFLVVAELYGFLRRAIEQKFDPIRWISPDEYLRSKKKQLDQASKLRDLAIDNIAELNEAKDRANQVAAQLSRLHSDLGEATAFNGALQSEKQVLRTELERAEARLGDLKEVLRRQEGARARLMQQSEGLALEATSAIANLKNTKVPIHPQIWNQVQNLAQNIDALRNEIERGSTRE